MTILLIVVIIFLVLLLGMFLAFLFTRADRAVTVTRHEMVAEERAYSPGVTLGHKIKVEASYEQQLKQARLEAAKKAAATPRGANSQIGRAGQSTLATAGKSVSSDAMTAVRIARFHGWDGARTGAPAVSGPAAAAPTAVASGARAAAPTIPPPTLIAITADMPPEEMRKARVANAKAQSAYNKALKAAETGAPVTTGGTVAAAPSGATAAAAPAAVSIEPPTLIEITPDMAPEAVRKARVANAKAEAAYNKALKAAGATAVPAQAAVAAPQPAAAAPVAAPAVGIVPPQLIEITDSMPPEEVRRARVSNAKAEAAYNKALKAAGIDPAAKAGEPAPAAPVEKMAPPEPAPSAAAAPVAGIAPPQLIEITDGMAPEEIRRARVENAKATAAYNKALKAAGIDPATLK
ncbi:MAG: hypothetical protein M9896_00900 [Candidatus Promineofilum sp.]|uniref:hypothetical protein n=1 Tax=Promineifilum sp. TaxID=2664178 RepID=UPI002411E97B|nr:hypothetical protein [Promineifilum sp.]